MNIFSTPSPLQKEWRSLIKQEQAFLGKKAEKQQSALNRLLEDKVPPTLQRKLSSAFCSAFDTVFSKGTPLIEKTYNKEKVQENAFINHTLASKANPSRRVLKRVSKSANKMANTNLAASTVTGVGLGALGIGLPDIVLFVSYVIRNMCQLSTSYNFDSNNENERRFMLMIIRGALTCGEQQKEANSEIDYYITNGNFRKYVPLMHEIKLCAECMSGELLYMKFLQGIPIVGAVGGAYDYVYMKQINQYARIKYQKRFLYGKIYAQHR